MVLLMGCCIILETPQSILQDDEVDVFETVMDGAFSDTERTACVKALWARFRYRGLGSQDRDYWLQNMKDRLSAIQQSYAEKFAIYEAYLESDFSDLAGSVTEHKVTTAPRQQTTTGEDMPDTAVGTSSYLSDRQTLTTIETEDNETTKVYTGLPQSTLLDALGHVQDPYEMFAKEFDKLFWWGL